MLVETEEITGDVSVATRDKAESEANEARKEMLTRLERECEEESKQELSCESVSLYNGGQHWLYKYKRYEDVRLVFAPESAIAAFGGDPDNFNFPRYCLDMAFLRAYENGRPARTPDHLAWRSDGPAEGEPVFISGHPGSTERLLSLAELKFHRDVFLPHWLLRYAELRGRMIQYGKTGEEPLRVVQSPLLGIENSFKVRSNELKALLDDELLARKEQEERKLRDAVMADPAMKAAYGSTWDGIAGALEVFTAFRDPYLFLERSVAFDGDLFGYARTLVRVAAEREKPDEKRLREYTETSLPQIQQRTFAKRPIYSDLEELRLSFSLEKLREFLGPDDPIVKMVLGKDSPDEVARALVSGTRLGDTEVRKALWEGGRKAIESSDDPMIKLALKVEPESRRLRKRYEDEVEAVVEANSEKIARARFAILGTDTYPDATFTLRVTYGSVKGWLEKGKDIHPFTTIGVAYDRATGDDPFRMPERWVRAKNDLDLDKRFNFVLTTDITGGNSGSPVMDKDGNLVGLAFDGNIHSIAGDYWFDESKNRTVAVHAAAMLEALDVAYEADALVGELTIK